MKFENLFHIMLICFLTLGACNRKEAENGALERVRFSLSADSSSVEVHKLPADVLDFLQADTLSEKQWQAFFGVYRQPVDAELKDFQKPLSGSYRLQDSLIIFSPSEDFRKDSVYFARFYKRNILVKPSDVILGDRGLSAETDVIEFDFKR